MRLRESSRQMESGLRQDQSSHPKASRHRLDKIRKETMSDKTYSEFQGIPAFDWNRELDRLIDGGELSRQEYLELIDKAGSWVTCACGNQCSIIPRAKQNGDGGRYRGAPLDETLYLLGCDFLNEAVGEKDWMFAKDILVRIEHRSAQLIREELARHDK